MQKERWLGVQRAGDSDPKPIPTPTSPRPARPPQMSDGLEVGEGGEEGEGRGG